MRESPRIALWGLMAAWSLVACSSAGADVTFSDATSGPLGDTGLGQGVAWGDYDQDGDLDLYLANNTGANKLFRNDGGGVFVDATSGPLGDTGDGQGVAWGDYDNDGDLDLYLSNWGSANKLFRNDGGGVFVDATSGPLGYTGQGAGVAWGDYDRDGDLDLYLSNWGSANKLFRNDGGGVFVDATSGPLGDTGQGVGVAWGDYDNDGDPDLYVANASQATSKLFRNDGGGVFVDATSGPLGSHGRGVAWGDYDNDGDLDIYLANEGQANKLFRNDGGGVFVDATSGPLGDTGQGVGVAWGDYDNDGDLDLYLANNGGANKLFRNDGGSVFVDATSGPLGDTGDGRGVAWGDYDQDGDLDLYLANWGEANKLFRNMNTTGNHWLHVSLVGTMSNRSGIGARVRVVTGSLRQIQEVSGGSGCLSQNSLTVEFGLGAASSVDTLEIRWPSGVVQRSTNVAADQRITVEERPFVDVASGALANSGNGQGVAWGDYDGDGDPDLFVGNSGPSKLLRNEGGNSFSDVTPAALNSFSNTTGAAWADADQDGDLDLFTGRYTGASRLFRNDGAGSFVDVTAGALVSVGNWESGIWGDFDGDGDLDIYAIASNTPNKLFRNDGGGVFVDATSGPLGNAGTSYGAAAGDYDNDGDLDIYLANEGQADKLFRNDGGGTFSDVTSGPLASGGGRGVAWGDYDNDGDLDLYVANFNGSNKLFRNDGGGSFANVTTGVLADAALASNAVAWADFENDGDLDLYVSQYNGPGRLFRNDGAGGFVDVANSPIANVGPGTAAAWADYDGDGDPDLYLAQQGAPNRLYRNENGPGNAWLEVDLEGVRANRSGIGARVRVVSGGVSQIREVSGGSGFRSQESLTVEFGLGAVVQVDTLEVRWRPGVVSRMTGVDVNQRLTIQEPGILRVPSYYATIQAAIQAAVSGDTVLVAAGTYSGPGNRDLNFHGKNLVLTYEGMVAGPWNGWSPTNETGRVIIDCEGASRGMVFTNGESPAAVVQGLTFVRGIDVALEVETAAPTFDRCIVTGTEGHGITVCDGNPTFINCTITGNHARVCCDNDGGGLSMGCGSGSLVQFTRCIVWGNCAGVGAEVRVSPGGIVQFAQSIVDTSQVGGGGTITYGSGNLFTNPRFCEPHSCYLAPVDGGSYTVASDSPALPANNAFGLLVGALGQGCSDPTVVWTGEGDQTTWQDAANWSVGEPQGGDKVVIEDLPVTSEVVYDESFMAGLLPVGEALLVALDTLTSSEPLWVVQGALQVTGAASVDTLVLLPGATLGGTGTVSVGVLKWRGGLMTDAGTTRVTDAMLLSTASDKSLRGGRLLESEGEWTWPGTGVLKEGDGTLGTKIRNEGTLTVAGARTVDHEPLWGTPAAFENVGTAAQTANSTFTVEAVVTNPGTIDVQSGVVDLTGGLTNFSGTSLSGGTYDVMGTLRFPGADIRTSTAKIVLDGAASSIVNESAGNGLAQFGVNGTTGDFRITNGRSLTVSSGFSNAGDVRVGPGSAFTVGGTYTQTGGSTTLSDTTSAFTANTANVQGGNITGAGTVTVTTLVNSGVLRPGTGAGVLSVTGNYQQTSTGELDIELGGYVPGVNYDVLEVTGTAQLSGRLHVDLIPPFDPLVGDSFGFLTATGISGGFSELRSFSMESHVAVSPTVANLLVDVKHSRFTGGAGSSWFNAGNWTNGLPTAGQDVAIAGAVVVDGGGTALAREVRVLGGGGSLLVQNGKVSCDTLRVRDGGILSLAQKTSKAVARTMRLEGSAQLVWSRGTVEVHGGQLTRSDGGLVVGDTPDTSTLVLSDGAVASVGGTLTVGRDFGDRGVIRLEGSGTRLNAGMVEVGMVGRGVLRVQEGSEVRTGQGGTLAPRTTVGPFGVLLGTGTVFGDVLNQGVVSPGPEVTNARSGAGVGMMRITGSYDQAATGVLEMEMGGTHSGGFDRLEVTGQARLLGTLRLVRLYQMAGLPDTAEVLGYGVREGTFGTVVVAKAALDDAVTVGPVYGVSGLRLVLGGTLGQIGVPEEAVVPRVFRVYPSYPNPFRSAATIQFDLPEALAVRLRIFDVQGRLVRTVIDDEQMEAGTHRRVWGGETEQGQHAASGVYFYRLDAGRDRQIRRMVKLE